MHFGKRLEKDLIEKWRPHYLQYKLLKKQIKELENGNVNDTDVDGANGLLASQQMTYQEFIFPGPRAHRYHLLSVFKPLLNKEVEKINDFTVSKVKEIQNRILQLLRTSTPWKDAVTYNVVEHSELLEWQNFLNEQLQEANALAEEIVDLDKFIRQNCIAVQKIIKKFDKRLSFDVSPWLNAQLMENEPFLKVNLDSLLMGLSDTYEMLNSYKRELEKFKKQTSDDGESKKGISSQSFERKTTKYWVKSEHLMKIKVAIIKNLPVYLFDRKQENINTVRSKNFLHDFQELYPNVSDSSAISSIYMDNNNLDIYHARLKREEGAQLFRLRWYGDAQSLPGKDVIFLERKTHHESWVEAKSVKERFPIKPKNVQAFLAGSFDPTENMHKWMKQDPKGVKLIKNESELQKANELASECRNSFQKLNLKPMVRTLYSRTAFQASDSNEVRISIDKNLMMVNENVSQDPNSEFPWCRDMVKTKIPTHDILHFPYCILEVKLNCEKEPEWIVNLLADTSAIVEKAKFSKFMTGIAFLQYNKVSELPYWFEGQVAIDPRNRFLPDEEKEKLIYEDSNTQFGVTRVDSDVTVGHGDIGSSSHHTITVHEEPNENTPLLGSTNNEKVSNVTFAEGTKFSKFSPMNIYNSLRRRISGTTMSPVQNDGRSRTILKPIRSANRIKIEPKTSFANERTLIQWVSAASLMITLATLIMTSGTELGVEAGFVFFPLAFVIMFYALIRFQYRAWSFRNRRNSYQDDLCGPVFLVISIASAMAVIVYLLFRTNTTIPPISPTVVENFCEQIQIESLPEYFPYSDLDVIGDSLVLVGPFSVAKSWMNGTSEVKKFEDANILSVAPSFENEALLGIENPFSLASYNFFTGRTRKVDLKFVQQSYNLTFKAMATINDRVLIPSKDGCIYEFRLSEKGSDGSVLALNLVNVIPRPRITAGLLDEPQFQEIASMFYESETSALYVMYSRSRVIRVFSWPKMSKIQEWSLPGNTFQWTGITIEQKDDEKYMILSQSIPSQVWSFKMDKKAQTLNAGLREVFPECANVYKGDFMDLIEKPNNDKFKRIVPKYVNDY